MSRSVEDVRRVFDEWARTTGHERCKLTADRRRKIEARLREFSVDELLLVPHGALADDWKDRDKHSDVGVLYRNAQQVDKFIALAQLGANGSSGHEEASQLAAFLRGSR